MPHNWTLEVVTRGVVVELNPITYQDIYAIAKEALVNAFRHSKASEIRAEICFETTRLTLDIFDNGRGIDPDILSGSKPADHWGLAGMQERADNLGAALKITIPPGGGTRVSLVISGSMAFRQKPKASRVANFGRGWLDRLRKTG